MKLHLKSFGSFIDHEFELPERPGLYFMRGDNRAEPRLGANGAGKSTVWSAIYWLLYGKTPKGLRAGDAANWDSKSSLVELFLSIKGVPHRAHRSWSPNLWRLTDMDTGEMWDLGADSQNQLLAHAGLTSQGFLNCVLMSQKEPMFLDLKPEAKTSLFSEVLNLERYLALSAEAGNRAKSFDNKARGLESVVASLQASLSAKQGESSSLLKKELDRWEQDRQEAVRLCKQLVQRAEDSLHSLDKQIAELNDREPKTEPLFRKRQEAQRALSKAADTFAEVQAEWRLLDAAERQLEGKKKCPTCGQGLLGSKERDQQLDHLEKLDKLLDQTDEAKLRAEQELERVDRQWRQLQQEVAEHNAKHRYLKEKRREVERDRDSAMLQLTREQGATNPYLVRIEQHNTSIRQLQAELQEAEAQLNDAQVDELRNSYWIRGFKDLRLQEIANALSELELEANNCLSQLGLSNWELRFDVDRETKGGSVQRGFAVTVLSPHNSRPVPWEAWSGGEAQRLRIACNMGLANLIRSRTACGLNLEVWDEPTAGLTQQGITDLLDALSERAQAEQRPIWVVDHHSLGYGGFEATCTVIKEKGTGSRIEWGL